MDRVFIHFWLVKSLIGKLKSNVLGQLEKEMSKQEIRPIYSDDYEYEQLSTNRFDTLHLLNTAMS